MKKSAFTLAEVLITLGIIGVVAAITLPTLIKNYKNQVYVTQLKKAVSIWEQGMQKMMADDGVDKLSNTELWGLINNAEYSADSDVTQHNAILKKYFKIADTYDGNDATDKGYAFSWDGTEGKYKSLKSEGGNNFVDAERKIVMQDGTIFGFNGHTKYNHCDSDYLGENRECKDKVGYIGIDVNGAKGPNRYGRDVFEFNLTDDGHLWANTGGDCSYEGFGCASRIIKNGWKMDY